MKELEDIFNIFHDGGIEGYEINGNDLRLKIGIEYLAELIHPTNGHMFLQLKNVETFLFEPWGNENTTISNWEDVLSFDLEFSRAKIDQNGGLVVNCHCHHSPKGDIIGGHLHIKCQVYELYTEAGDALGIEHLKELSGHYWNEKFGKN